MQQISASLLGEIPKEQIGLDQVVNVSPVDMPLSKADLELAEDKTIMEMAGFSDAFDMMNL